MEYEKLLDETYKKVKPIKSSNERFEIPHANSIIEGSKTIISNFSQVTSALRRSPEHLSKFLQRELATPSKVEADRLVMQRKIPNEKINEKIKEYVEEFVICKECKKPDTELLKEGNFMFVHCLACGAKHSVRAKI